MSTQIPVNVRMYHVGFGDCFLITIGKKEATRRILVDCGQHIGSKPEAHGANLDKMVGQLFEDLDSNNPVVDVIVVSHRHQDHVEGFARQPELWRKLRAREIWLPWIEDPIDPIGVSIVTEQEACAKIAFAALTSLSLNFRTASDAASKAARAKVDDAITIVYNSSKNKDAFEQLVGPTGFRNPEGGPPTVRYLPRLGFQPDVLSELELNDVLPNVRVHVLGPSRDPQVMRRLNPPNDAAYLALAGANRRLPADASDIEKAAKAASEAPAPFAPRYRAKANAYSFKKGELDDVRSTCASGLSSPLAFAYRLDHAVNGTSLVLLFEIGDLRLLFPGDAQWGTWQAMLENPTTRKLLHTTTFLKVGHHGSHNATPKEFVRDVLDDGRLHGAMVPVGMTSYGGGWQDIPRAPLLRALRRKTPVALSNRRNTKGAQKVFVRSERYTDMTMQATIGSDDDA